MKKLGISPFGLFVGMLGLGVTGVLAVAVVALFVSPSLPSAETLRDIRLKVPLRVYSAEGRLMAEFGEERRLPVRIGEVPPTLVQAILAAEDDSFYHHQGVDLFGILRAALANLKSGEHGQGASTITMQVARNYFLSPEKTYTRKIKEILLAFKIEQELTKNQILELYVNKIFLGHRAYGFGAAAQVYYGRPLAELSLPQLAMLAGLPKAPSRDNPLSNPDNARARRNYVLGRMYKLGFIDRQAYEAARDAPLTASRHLAGVEVAAPYVAEMVRNEMVRRHGESAYGGGYKVYTTVVGRYQAAADAALRRGLVAYERRHGYRGPVKRLGWPERPGRDWLDEVLREVPAVGHLRPAVVTAVAERSVTAYLKGGEGVTVAWEGLKWARPYRGENRHAPAPRRAGDVLRPGDVVYLEPRAGEGATAWWLAQVPQVGGAIVSIDPRDGRILALAGGFDFFASKFNRVIQARRQPGSNIKPFIYSAALEKGFTAASRVSGAPIVIPDVALEDVWRPENYSGKFFGPTPLRRALTLSLNLVSVRLLRAIGPGYAVDYLRHFGFDPERLPRNLSLALGTASLTPLEVVRAYAVFANGGFLVAPWFIQRVEDGDGRVLERAEPAVVCPACEPDQPRWKLAAAAGEDEAGEAVAVALPETDLRPDGAVPPAAAGGDRPAAPRHAPRVISAENAFIMTSMMQDVIAAGTGRRARVLGRGDLAGKTGTTNDYRDAWFSGFNRDVVTTVWVGFDQPRTLGRGEAGGRAALPIWIDYMRVVLDGRPERPPVPPRGVVTAYLNRETGQPTDEDDPEAYREYFMAQAARPAPGPVQAGDAPVVQMPAAAGGGEDKLPEGLF